MKPRYEVGKGIVLEGTNQLKEAVDTQINWKEARCVACIVRVGNRFETVVGGELGVELLGTLDLLRDSLISTMMSDEDEDEEEEE